MTTQALRVGTVNDQPPPMSRPRVAAGALFTDEDGNVLLVKPTYKDGWDIPGGYVEPRETPREACAREVNEELSLTRPIGGLLVVDWAPSESEGDKVLFVFDGGTLVTAELQTLSLPTDELSAHAFQPGEALDDLMPPRLVRRVRAAIDAQRAGETRYLEHGDAT
jgi:8-oxo-dGTP diphosphatase